MPDPVPVHTLPGLPTWRDAITALRTSPDARRALTDILRADPADAFLFETRPTRRSQAARTPFEFVLLPAPPLARAAPDPHAFAAHFRPGARAATFPNLSGSATLIAPSPAGLPTPGAGTHLAAFARQAPDAHLDALWQHTAAAVEMWWLERADPVWLSTHGFGVFWLHIRLDRRPKYYRHAPYKARPSRRGGG